MAAATHSGGNGELFQAKGAQLFLVESGESVLMQSGRFALTLVKNPGSELAAMVAMVGVVQWPVGRDSCVGRDGEGSFTFTLPGAFTYGLVLEPTTTTSADLQRLEHILEEYSDWQKSPHAEDQMLQSDISTRPRVAADIPSPPLMGKMLRARRMSAVVKVFSKSLERGAINAASHVEPADISTAPSRQQILWNPALASVDAVTRVVKAVETGGRTLLESVGSGSASSEEQEHNLAEGDTSSDSTMSGVISSGWTLNKLGLLKLFRVITTSMAIHSNGSSSGGSSRSGSSSSSGFHRLLSSSSSSSSSFSSKSPVTPTSHVKSNVSGDVTSTMLMSLQMPTAAGMPSMSTPVPPPPPFFSHQTLLLQTPASTGMPSTSTPVPPRPPFFFHQTVARPGHSSMPPPSGPPPAVSGRPEATVIASEPLASMPFHIYKPRAMSAASVTVAPAPPSFLGRPPRFQPPPKS